MTIVENLDAEKIVLRSSIKPALMRFALWRGMLLAALGVGILLISGGFLPLIYLSTWGFPLFLLGVGLITAGLLPYRRLRAFEMNPHRLEITEEWILFFIGGKRYLSIPRISIAHMEYIGEGRLYGIGLHFHWPIPKKVVIHTPQLTLQLKEKSKLKNHTCDLFLPYFTQHSFKNLYEIYDQDNHSRGEIN